MRFNPRPHAGGDDPDLRAATFFLFQSTPPRGGRRTRRSQCQAHNMFQSTPPRGGRHTHDAVSAPSIAVSIHAPTRGATKLLKPPLMIWMFQSTPPRGGRLSRKRRGRDLVKFQSTPPRGGRLNLGIIIDAIMQVSIHAPTRGATAKSKHGKTTMRFQSTPPRGGRRGLAYCGGTIQYVSIHAPTRGATDADPPINQTA